MHILVIEVDEADEKELISIYEGLIDSEMPPRSRLKMRLDVQMRESDVNSSEYRLEYSR